MPVTLRQEALHIKDGNTGEYKDASILVSNLPEAASQIEANAKAAIQTEGTAQVAAVTAEGTTQVTAIQNKGTEVLASIPADYSALTQDVSALKSTTLPLLTDKAFSLAGYIRISDGKFVSATTNNFCTDYIAVHIGDMIFLNSRQSPGRAQFAFYTDMDGNGYQLIADGTNLANAVSFTAQANGYVRLGASYIDSFPITVYCNEEIPKQFTNKINNVVSPVNLRTKNNTESISGIVNMDKYNLEAGSIAITTSGWEYSDNTKRVRTPEGTTIHLQAGDIVKLSDYTNARFGLGWLNMAGNYGTASWQQQDFVCPVEGDYVFIMSYYPETALTETTRQTLINMFSIYQVGNMLNHNILTNAYTNIRFCNHKGYSSIAPEDTLPAYLLSKQRGFDMVECDVSFTAADANHPNGVPVLLHDETIDRTSNGTGNIYDLTFDQVRQYDFGSWKNVKYTGTMIPSFEEFIKFCKFAGLKSQCELKTAGNVTEAKIRMCTDIVKHYGMTDAITWTSGSAWNLSVVKTELPTARLGLIVHTMGASTISDAVSLKTASNDVFLSLSKSIITDETVAAIMSAGLPLEAFIVNYIAELESLHPYVSGVTTNLLNVPVLSYEYAKKLSSSLVLS